jgi:hypothetical protein
MIIRGLSPRDIPQVSRIHERFHKTEFSLEEFNQNYLSQFGVFENERLITAGGVRLIPEVVIVTDQENSVRERRAALYYMLQTSLYIAGNNGYDSIHAFVQDEGWLRHLLKVGFKPTVGTSVVMGVK